MQHCKAKQPVFSSALKVSFASLFWPLFKGFPFKIAVVSLSLRFTHSLPKKKKNKRLLFMSYLDL